MVIGLTMQNRMNTMECQELMIRKTIIAAIVQGNIWRKIAGIRMQMDLIRSMLSLREWDRDWLIRISTNTTISSHSTKRGSTQTMGVEMGMDTMETTIATTRTTITITITIATKGIATRTTTRTTMGTTGVVMGIATTNQHQLYHTLSQPSMSTRSGMKRVALRMKRNYWAHFQN